MKEITAYMAYDKVFQTKEEALAYEAEHSNELAKRYPSKYRIFESVYFIENNRLYFGEIFKKRYVINTQNQTIVWSYIFRNGLEINEEFIFSSLDEIFKDLKSNMKRI